MADTVEKIYCTDRDNNDALTAAALVANGQNNNQWPMAAAMMNGGAYGANNWMNNPFAYLMFMPFMASFAGGNGWGNNGNDRMEASTQRQIQQLSDQVTGNHNTDLTNQNIDRTQTAVMGLAGGVNTGFGNLAQDVNGVQNAIQTTGCGIKTAILESGYQTQLGNERQTNTILMGNQALQNVFQNGMTMLGFQVERNACDVKETSTANTQKIIDTLNNHWNLEQQNIINQLRDELGRANQTQALIAALGGGAAAAAAGTTIKTSAA